MEKRYLKKIVGEDDLVVVKQPPIWGKQPDFYRGVDWNINGIWHSSVGEDILNSTDPFGDGSLMHKWRLNGDLIDLVTGNEATAVGELVFDDGMFDSKCYASKKAGPGTYINCGNISRNGKKEITISGWVRYTTSHELGSSENSWSCLWKLNPSDLNVDGYTPGEYARQPAIYYNYNDKKIYYTNDTIDNNDFEVYKKLNIGDISNKFIHIVQVVTEYEQRLYINGVLDSNLISNSPYLFNDGIFLIGSNIHYSTSFDTQQIEMYNRALTDDEIKVLYNQQKLVVQRHDGLNGNPKPFTYLEQDDKLIVTTVDVNGNITGQSLEDKIGYIKDNDNLVKIENNELVDRYGKNVLSGKVNRVIQHTSYTHASSHSVGDWQTFNKCIIDMDTDKYDYIITLTCVVHTYGNINEGGGADINIQANRNNLVTLGHMHYGQNGNMYNQVTLTTPRITNGYKGKIVLTASLSCYNSYLDYVNNHNNGGIHSGRDTANNKSDFIIFEVFKGE